MAGWVIVAEFGTGAMQPHVFGTWVTEEAAQAQADAWELRVAQAHGFDSPSEMTDFATRVVPVLPKATGSLDAAWRNLFGEDLPK